MVTITAMLRREGRQRKQKQVLRYEEKWIWIKRVDVERGCTIACSRNQSPGNRVKQCFGGCYISFPGETIFIHLRYRRKQTKENFHQSLPWRINTFISVTYMNPGEELVLWTRVREHLHHWKPRVSPIISIFTAGVPFTMGSSYLSKSSLPQQLCTAYSLHSGTGPVVFLSSLLWVFLFLELLPIPPQGKASVWWEDLHSSRSARSRVPHYRESKQEGVAACLRWWVDKPTRL